MEEEIGERKRGMPEPAQVVSIDDCWQGKIHRLAVQDAKQQANPKRRLLQSPDRELSVRYRLPT